MDYGRGPPASLESRFPQEVPDMVQQFVVYFYRHIRERNIREIFQMYEVSFTKLSERFFKASPWPKVDLIADLVDNDHVFCLLYKELYFRHLYAVTQPSLGDRVESWDNYCALFNVILHGNVNMQLPHGWLWDMVDEFIYQFSTFSQYRGKMSTKLPQELTMLRQIDSVWTVLTVLNYLQALVDKSEVANELSTEQGTQRLYETEGYEPRGSNVLRMLGYFSLVGLARVHSLVGDYHGALRAIAPLNPFQRKNLLTPKIAGAHITLYYYAGFSYLMQRRYLDAANCFNTVLGYIIRVKAFHARSSSYDQILKKNEQMYALLAITVSLCPAASRLLDEGINNALREKLGEKIVKMSRGGDGAFDELFSYACPKFITAAPPGADSPLVNTSQEAYRLQLRNFMALIAQHRHLPTLKQFLKLYTSISLPKLASLMDMDEAVVRAQLQLLKSTSYCLTYPGTGDATAGTLQNAADVDFFIDIDPETAVEMVTISDAKPVRRQGEFLARHVGRFEEVVRDLDALARAPVTAVAALPGRGVSAY